MHRSKLFSSFAVIAALTLTAGAAALGAATWEGPLTFPDQTVAGSSCSTSTIGVSFSWSATTQDDGAGNDWVAGVVYDGSGTAIGYWSWYFHAPTANLSSVNTGIYTGTFPINTVKHIADLTFAPVKVVIYDLSAAPSGTPTQEVAQAEASPILAQGSFDPRTDPNLSTVCAGLTNGSLAIPALSPWGLTALILLLAGAALALVRKI